MSQIRLPYSLLMAVTLNTEILTLFLSFKSLVKDFDLLYCKTYSTLKRLKKPRSLDVPQLFWVWVWFFFKQKIVPLKNQERSSNPVNISLQSFSLPYLPHFFRVLLVFLQRTGKELKALTSRSLIYLALQEGMCMWTQCSLLLEGSMLT